MKQYKGIIFNSVNIGLLNGELGRVVSANNIRTAVVSRKTRAECRKFLKARGISVDVVIGGHDLDTRCELPLFVNFPFLGQPEIRLQYSVFFSFPPHVAVVD